MRFDFLVRDNTQKAFRSFIGFLLFFQLLAAGIISANTASSALRAELLSATGVFLLLILLFLFFAKKNKGMLNLAGIALLLAGSI